MIEKMKISSLFNDFIRKFGLEIKKYPSSNFTRRMKLIKYAGINKIFDVGANTGEYGVLMRKLGFKGSMVSFEPLKEEFEVLKRRATLDKNWLTVNMALGDFNGETFINVSANSYSSSILDIMPSHIKGAPDSAYIKSVKIKIKKIDSIINDYAHSGDNILLKIDTQGFEKKVIDGARESFQRFKGIQMEMSLEPLYKGETTFFDMVEYIKGFGFHLYSIEDGLFDPETGKLLQLDGIFLNKSL